MKPYLFQIHEETITSLFDLLLNTEAELLALSAEAQKGIRVEFHSDNKHFNICKPDSFCSKKYSSWGMTKKTPSTTARPPNKLLYK